MTKRAMAWAAIKALVAAEISALSIGLLFAGINIANEWLFSDCCVDGGGVFLTVLRFWQAWWWFIFGVIYNPAWLFFLIYFIRRLAAAGNRLGVAGMVFVFQGSIILIGTIAILATADDPDSAELLALGALGAIMLLGGWYLAFKRPGRP